MSEKFSTTLNDETRNLEKVANRLRTYASSAQLLGLQELGNILYSEAQRITDARDNLVDNYIKVNLGLK